MRALALLCLLAQPATAEPAAAEPAVPSGLRLTALDTLVESQPGGETWLILRYLAPEIAGRAVGYESVLPDLDHLCLAEGIRAVAETGLEIDQIVVIVMDRVVPRGASDADATQYIGAYLPMGKACLPQ